MAKSDPNLLTQAEYARSRKARGLSGGTRQAVKKAVDEKRISVFGPDKLVDQALADTQWDRNTRARVTTTAPSSSQPPMDTYPPDLLAPVEGHPAAPAPAPAAEQPAMLHGDLGYLRSRAAQAEADARIAQMKAAELEGTLVRIDQVKAELAAKLAPVREGLLQLPARLAAPLAAQADPARIQTMLEAELHQVLAPLAKLASQDAGQLALPQETVA